MPKTLQQELANGITNKFKDAVVKKIDKDNYLDIHLPSVHPKRGTHLGINTAKGLIKIVFYCREEQFNEQVLANSKKIEAYGQGLRIKDNPTFTTVEKAVEAAIDFVLELMRVNRNVSKSEINQTKTKKATPQKAAPKTAAKKKNYRLIDLNQENTNSIKKNNQSNDFRVQIEGEGSEMKYEILTNKEYEEFLNYKKINEIDNSTDAWIEFINEEKQKEFWDYNGLADFTGILLDELKISVFNKSNDLIFISSYWGIDEEIRENYIEENSINDSDVKGKYIYPKKDNLVVFRSFENFQFEFNIQNISKFTIEDLGIIRVSSDEIGFGKDYGDYCIGITYKGKSYRPTDYPPQNYKNYEINFECF